MVIIITGRYIRELREEMGISQNELARRVGVSQAHIAKIELEKVDPRLSTINKILSVLKTNEKKTKCRNLMVNNIISVSPNDSVKKSIALMRNYDISQLPVMENQVEVGSIKESTIVRNSDKDLEKLTVKDIMEEPFPIVNAEDGIDIVKSLLEFHPAVLVNEKGKIIGIITKYDLLTFL